MVDEKKDTDRLPDEVTRRKLCPHFDGVQMFNATLAKERARLGETISAWMAKNRHLKVVDWWITQSSDNAFHCVTMTLFYVRPVVSRDA